MTGDERHRMDAILEDMNGKFDLLLEGHTALDQKIDRVQATSQNQHAEALAMIKTVHDSLRDELKEDIRVVGEKVDGHECLPAAHVRFSSGPAMPSVSSGLVTAPRFCCRTWV